MTVRGLLPAPDMGFTLPHEHLLVRHQGPLVDMTDETCALEEMQRYYRFGGRTLVEMTNLGLQRKPDALRRISAKSGVNVVMATGFYKDAWLPAEAHQMTIAEMAQSMITDILTGDPETGIQAGVIGELGVSRQITATEEKCLAAAARAHLATGAAINIHFDIGTTLAEYRHAVHILETEGADLNRVVLDHFICRPDELEIGQELSGHGCYIEFDLFGQEIWTKILDLTGNTTPEVQVSSLAWFLQAGMRERILISQDVGNRVCLHSNGGYGYTHILKTIIPQLKEYGVTDEDIRVLTVDNPRRLFPFR